MSDVKRWQFSMRGIIAYMTLAALPFGVWQLAWIGDGAFAVIAVTLAVIAANGVFWASLGWLLNGTTRVFWLGYVSGVAVPGLFTAFALLFLFCAWLVSAIYQ